MGTKGRKTARESDGGGYWRWLSVEYGTTGEGWIAGDLHIVPVHPGRPSVVCVDALQGTKGECPLCGPATDVQDLGYQPVFRDDNVPCVLTIHQHQFEMVEGFSHGTPIKWGRRGGDEAESVYVFPRLTARHYETTLPSRRRPADITIAICRYWKRPELLPVLARWFNAGPVIPPAAPEPVKVITPIPPRVRDRMGPARGGRKATLSDVTDEPAADLIGEAARAMLSRVKAREAEKNGTSH